MPKIKVIGLDAAKVAGFAFKNISGKWDTGTFKVADKDAMDCVLRVAKAQGATVAAVEWPYHGASVQTLISLTESATRIIVACEAIGLKVVKVRATVWQASFGITGRREFRKAGAAKMAKHLGLSLPVPKTAKERSEHEDICDAACLCDWAVHNSPEALAAIVVDVKGGT